MSERIFTAACVQLQASQNVAANIDAAEALIREAAGTGADYVQTPEQTALMELRTEALFANIVAEEDDPALARLRALASELRIWLHIGSLAIKVAGSVISRFLVATPQTLPEPLSAFVRISISRFASKSWHRNWG